MSAAEASPASDLFFHEVRRDGRPLVTLRGVATAGGAVVETQVFPLVEGGTAEPLRRPFPFPSAHQAGRFVDEALTALEYLGCVVAERVRDALPE